VRGERDRSGGKRRSVDLTATNELAPDYDLNDRMMGMSDVAGVPSVPARTPRPMPSLPIGAVRTTLGRRVRHLGLALVAGRHGSQFRAASKARCLQPLRCGRGASPLARIRRQAVSTVRRFRNCR
jgi:hypothetical protein